MDGIDARNLDHHAIATHVLGELDGVIESPAWWAQSVTVAYEQHIGRRLPGQQPDGTFQTSVSKSTSLSMAALMDKWVEFAAQDDEVRALSADEVRVSGTDKRITWRTKAPDGSAIRITSEPRPNGTASIIALQMGLDTHERNLEAKAQWTSILQRFLQGL
jgi:hypothetical protein